MNLLLFGFCMFLVLSPQTLCEQSPSDFFKNLLGEELDPYSVLNISRHATSAEIKRAFRKLAVETHPDKHPKDRESAERRFRDVALAYEVLKHPKRRKQYDTFGHFDVDIFKDLSKNFNVADVVAEVFQGEDFKGAQSMSDFAAAGSKVGAKLAEKLRKGDPSLAQKFRDEVKATPDTLATLRDSLASLQDLAGSMDTQNTQRTGKGKGKNLADTQNAVMKNMDALGEISKTITGMTGTSNSKLDKMLEKVKAVAGVSSGKMPDMRDALSSLGLKSDDLHQALGGSEIGGSGHEDL